jgi:hypothetical protein
MIRLKTQRSLLEKFCESVRKQTGIERYGLSPNGRLSGKWQLILAEETGWFGKPIQTRDGRGRCRQRCSCISLNHSLTEPQISTLKRKGRTNTTK